VQETTGCNSIARAGAIPYRRHAVNRRQTRRCAIEANHNRSWLAITVAVEALHLAAGAVDVFAEMAVIAVAGRQRGDDEAGVCFTLRPLRLGNDAPLAAPALACRPHEVLEAARRPAGFLALLAGGRIDACLRDKPEMVLG
jgi:hypothetical protein